MIGIPTVSILVPTYRHVSFIGDCLDSILQQSLIEECEVLVGEDGSDDGTREICMRYMNAHPGRIRLSLNLKTFFTSAAYLTRPLYTRVN